MTHTVRRCHHPHEAILPLFRTSLFVASTSPPPSHHRCLCACATYPQQRHGSTVTTAGLSQDGHACPLCDAFFSRCLAAQSTVTPSTYTEGEGGCTGFPPSLTHMRIHAHLLHYVGPHSRECMYMYISPHVYISTSRQTCVCVFIYICTCIYIYIHMCI